MTEQEQLNVMEEPISDDLEQASYHEAMKLINDNKFPLPTTTIGEMIQYFKRLYKAGAQWQEEKDKELLKEEGLVILPEEQFETMKRTLIKLSTEKEQPINDNMDEEIVKEWKKFLKDGDIGFVEVARHFANWQKQQIMKEAVEREVKVDAGGYPYIDATELYDYDEDMPLAKAGDKVKIIVVK